MNAYDDLPYAELEREYQHFSMGYLGVDINTKFALISLICYLTEKLRAKKLDVTYYQVVYNLAHDSLPDAQIKGLAIMCKDFAYGCKEFPTFGIENKNIPGKIKEILSNWVPF